MQYIANDELVRDCNLCGNENCSGLDIILRSTDYTVFGTRDIRWIATYQAAARVRCHQRAVPRVFVAAGTMCAALDCNAPFVSFSLATAHENERKSHTPQQGIDVCAWPWKKASKILRQSEIFRLQHPVGRRFRRTDHAFTEHAYWMRPVIISDDSQS